MGLGDAVDDLKGGDEDEEDSDEVFSFEDDSDNPKCPECEKEGEDSGYWYYRCNTPESECRVMTFIIPGE